MEDAEEWPMQRYLGGRGRARTGSVEFPWSSMRSMAIHFRASTWSYVSSSVSRYARSFVEVDERYVCFVEGLRLPLHATLFVTLFVADWGYAYGPQRLVFEALSRSSAMPSARPGKRRSIVAQAKICKPGFVEYKMFSGLTSRWMSPLKAR